MINSKIDQLITDALAIEYEDARKAGKVAFMARALVQATLPHSKPEVNEFTRTNGAFSLTMLSPKAVGLPYGTIPRLLIAWLTTEAVRTKHPHIELGSSLSAFMADIGIGPATGGRWGSISRLREQINRLFRCYIACSYTGLHESGAEIDQGRNVLLVDEYCLWWNPKEPNQGLLWRSFVDLNPTFFNEITDNPIPVDMRAIKALKKSPLALDIYCWLTYRMSYLRQQTHIPWELLQMQFGSNYPLTTRGKLDFKANFRKRLKAVQVVYPIANLDESDRALILHPGRSHIPLRLG